jgi:hypothetical protein
MQSRPAGSEAGYKTCKGMNNALALTSAFSLD